MTWENSLTTKLTNLHSIGLQRNLRIINDATKPFLLYNGKKILNLSSNNYLGLAHHADIIQCIRDTNIEAAAGMASSRLVLGHDEKTAQLEKKVAHQKNTESSLLFSNGYMMNIGVLSSLLEPTDAVLSDQYNHASIVDGIRLTKAHHFRYRHNNMDHLEALLKKATQRGVKRKLIVTETVFSMDGDIAPLHDIIYLKNKYHAALITDDAHGDGVFGSSGEGVTHHLGLEQEVDLHLGTFSKAYGVYGAYAAGKREWINYLIHTCRSLIYTTALPPYVVRGISKAVDLVQRGAHLRTILEKKSDYFRSRLNQAGFHIKGTTQVIPIVIGNEKTTLDFSKRLLDENIMGVAIRPPTVPIGESRIRFTLMADIPWEEVKRAVTIITMLGKEMDVI